MSMKGRLAQYIYILVGGRMNSPFPMGALKVAVSGRSERSGWGVGGQYTSVVLESPNFNLTKKLGFIPLLARASTLLLRFLSGNREMLWGGGGNLGQHEPCWLLD